MQNWSKIKKDKKLQEYISFIQQKQKVYFLNNFPWINYQGILKPATPLPVEPPKFSKRDIQKILKKSGRPLIRWSSNFTDREAKWWWTICQKPTNTNQNKDLRYGVRRGKKNCNAQIISVSQLLQSGYQCYKSAFKRYRNAQPVSKESWRQNIKKKDFFDFWGVFYKEKLVGYAKILHTDSIANTQVIKYNPKHLKQYSSYVLIYKIINHYLKNKNLDLVANGTKPIAHDTNMQRFLEKFGFEKKYCKLNVVYSPSFEKAVNIAYTFRKITNKLESILPENNLLHKINVILKQEEIRRSFNKDEK